MEIKEIQLVQTCGACPEAYDAFLGDKQVGYLRLRHGFFRVDFPDYRGEQIVGAYPEGYGMFLDHEREMYLSMAKSAIMYKLGGGIDGEA